MSLAVAGINAGGRVRAAYPGALPVLPLADPRALGIAPPPPQAPPPAGSGLDALSESVRDRVTLSARIRRSPELERTARRKQPLAQPTTRDTASQSLSEMADAVADRVTLTQRNERTAAAETTYTSRGTRVADPAGAPSAELDLLAEDVTDQVTLTGGGSNGTPQPDEITVYIAGNGHAGGARPPVPGFAGMALLPAVG
jgi:hypothetical protein